MNDSFTFVSQFYSKFYSNFVTASFASCLATVCTHPLSTLAIQKQVQFSQKVNLWKGLNYSLCRQFLYGGLRLGMYNTLLGDFSPFTSGLISSTIASGITVPLDALRVQKQTGISTFKFLNCYRGTSLTLIRNIALGSISLPLMTILSEKTDSKLVGSASASFISTLCIHPLSVLKNNAIAYQNQSWLKNRIKLQEVYAGLGWTLCRVLPHFVITNLVSDWIKNQ